jgi:hypothetical protein
MWKKPNSSSLRWESDYVTHSDPGNKLQPGDAKQSILAGAEVEKFDFG